MTATRPAGSDLLPHLRRARDHIDRNYAAPLDLDRLAPVAGMSKYHFVRRQLEKGQQGGLGLTVDDCRKTFEELSAKGVEFLQEPSERPYGVEAVMRDVSGNWLVLVEPRAFTPADVR